MMDACMVLCSTSPYAIPFVAQRNVLLGIKRVGFALPPNTKMVLGRSQHECLHTCAMLRRRLLAW